MADTGPSTRFRSIALSVLAAGGAFLPAAVLGAGSLGLLPTDSTRDPRNPTISSDPAAVAAYGASGIRPQSAELSESLLARLVADHDMSSDPTLGIPPGSLTVPPAALAAYQRAESALAVQQPRCRVPWTLLAGLGKVISDHGSGSLGPDGNSTRPLLGPRLDGSPGLANLPDSDGGQLDDDTQWDRATGPLQIIPTVWRRVGGDSDGDGYASPHNIFDASLAAGRYLCEGSADLAKTIEQAHAVFRYQRSDLFVRAVVAWAQAYGPRLVPAPAPGPALPPVEEIPPQSDSVPSPGPLPHGAPQPPVSVLPVPGPASPSSTGTPRGLTVPPRTTPPASPPSISPTQPVPSRPVPSTPVPSTPVPPPEPAPSSPPVPPTTAPVPSPPMPSVTTPPPGRTPPRPVPTTPHPPTTYSATVQPPVPPMPAPPTPQPTPQAGLRP